MGNAREAAEAVCSDLSKVLCNHNPEVPNVIVALSIFRGWYSLLREALDQPDEIERLTRERDEAREDNARLRAAIEEAVKVDFPQSQRDYVNRVNNPLRRALEKNDD